MEQEIGPCGKGVLYHVVHNDRRWIAKRIPRMPNAEALKELKREYGLGYLLGGNPHMHPILPMPIDYTPPPEMHLRAARDSLAGLKRSHFEANGCFREGPLDVRLFGNAKVNAWLQIADQLALATHFLLSKGYAHMNLNPDTILYNGVPPHIRCWVTDYGSLEPESEVVLNPIHVPNSVYTLPYRQATKRYHALAQVLCTLLDLVCFNDATDHGRSLSSSPNIWHFIQEAWRQTEVDQRHIAWHKLYNTAHSSLFYPAHEILYEVMNAIVRDKPDDPTYQNELKEIFVRLLKSARTTAHY